MKSLVIYSSRTGNTKKVADAIFEILPEPKEIYPVQDAPPPESYDFIIIGFWVNRGTADIDAQQYMKSVQGKKVALFGTLGAYPDSPHAQTCMERVKKLVTANDFLGGFMCQGKVDSEVIQKMSELAPEKHPMTEERRNRLEEAKHHPNERDLKNAQTAFSAMVQKLICNE